MHPTTSCASLLCPLLSRFSLFCLGIETGLDSLDAFAHSEDWVEGNITVGVTVLSLAKSHAAWKGLVFEFQTGAIPCRVDRLRSTGKSPRYLCLKVFASCICTGRIGQSRHAVRHHAYVSCKIFAYDKGTLSMDVDGQGYENDVT